MTLSENQAPLLRISALTKRFGGFTALDNVSVDIRPGERFGLIGPNGSGKTTLINCISGAFRTEPGTVLFRDEDITPLQPHLRTRRGIARSFQIPRPFRSMTVAENLMVALDFAAHEHVSVGDRREAMMSILTQSFADLFIADTARAGWDLTATVEVEGGPSVLGACLPPETTRMDIIWAFVRYARAHRNQLAERVTAILIPALVKKFPCEKP